MLDCIHVLTIKRADQPSHQLWWFSYANMADEDFDLVTPEEKFLPNHQLILKFC